MNDQTKTPGAMVQITHEQLRDLVAGYCGPNALGELYALADAPAEQTPAVGGDANVRWDAVAKEQMQIIDRLNRELETITNDRDAEKRMKSCARLQRDIQREIVILKCARIAELEAQQGEPVAVIDEGDDGLFAEFIYGEDGSPLRRGDKLYLNPADKGYVSKLAYQAMKSEVERLSAQPPALGKTVLPERRAVSEASREQAMCANAWNACLDEIVKLNQ